jgi:hypothetical protein
MRSTPSLIKLDGHVNTVSSRSLASPKTSLVFMKDGARLRKALDDHGKGWTDLRDAAGKSKAMVYQYFGMERFSDEVRGVLRRALEKMGIDPSSIEEHREGEITDPDELRRLLSGIPDSQLPAVKRIMKATRVERLTLEALINDRIERRK